MDPSETGLWKNAITSGDACWLTPGYFSQNAKVTIQIMHCFTINIYHKGETLHIGTSKAAEGEGLSKLFEKASKEGMHISTHVQDLIRLIKLIV